MALNQVDCAPGSVYSKKNVVSYLNSFMEKADYWCFSAEENLTKIIYALFIIKMCKIFI